MRHDVRRVRARRVAIVLEPLPEDVQLQQREKLAVVDAPPTDYRVTVGVLEQQILGDVTSHIEATVETRETPIAVVVYRGRHL